MWRNRKGFTAVELLVVMVILAILIALTIMGLGAYSRRGKERDTRAILQSLTAMLKENERNLPITINPVPSPGNVKGTATDRTGAVVQQTRAVLVRLRAIPANKTAMDNLGTDHLWTFNTPANDPNLTVPVVLDGWGNPIIFVPAGGLAQVTSAMPPTWNRLATYNAGTIVRAADSGGHVEYFTVIGPKQGADPWATYNPNDPQNWFWFRGVLAPNNRPFFVSAGPDGNVQNGDDNLYSFDN